MIAHIYGAAFGMTAVRAASGIAMMFRQESFVHTTRRFVSSHIHILLAPIQVRIVVLTGLGTHVQDSTRVLHVMIGAVQCAGNNSRFGNGREISDE